MPAARTAACTSAAIAWVAVCVIALLVMPAALTAACISAEMEVAVVGGVSKLGTVIVAAAAGLGS